MAVNTVAQAALDHAVQNEWPTTAIVVHPRRYLVHLVYRVPLVLTAISASRQV
ncbi:hypothetical protein [Ruegeria sp. HKCCSP351]|uniref:hypothetical protein n=1 Tax=Ruegeria sp. HKCCSP351 TaxID=2794832 RepID=UPI001AE7D519|nr:hypothetical protein [Ruegeria sp. HKCCSP351]